MTRNVVVSGAFALALSAASAAHAATDAELAQIRDEIRQMKESYEARIQALEQRLKDAETRTASAPTARLEVNALGLATVDRTLTLLVAKRAVRVAALRERASR